MRISICTLWFEVCILCSFNLVTAGELSPRKPWWADDPSVLEPQVRATYEVPGRWKATVYSRIWPRSIYPEGKEFQIENTLCYVEVTAPESQNPRRVWQQTFATMTQGSPDTILRGFVLGPADDNRFCLAFLRASTVFFATIDANNNLGPMEDSASEAGPQGSEVTAKPSEVIQLSQIRDRNKGFLRHVSSYRIVIDAISSYAGSATIHLHMGAQKAALRFFPDDKDTRYEVYLLDSPGANQE